MGIWYWKRFDFTRANQMFAVVVVAGKDQFYYSIFLYSYLFATDISINIYLAGLVGWIVLVRCTDWVSEIILFVSFWNWGKGQRWPLFRLIDKCLVFLFLFSFGWTLSLWLPSVELVWLLRFALSQAKFCETQGFKSNPRKYVVVTYLSSKTP